MTRTYGDGSSIEIGGGTDRPPGWRGQHTNVNRDWVRKDGGGWHPSRCRTRAEAMLYINAADNADDAFDAILRR